MRVRFGYASLLALVCLAGCSGGEGQVIGSWTGKPKFTAEQEKDPRIQPYISLIGPTDLVVDKNHSYTMTSRFMDSQLVVKGTWKFGGTTMVLIPGKIGDQYVDELRSSFKDNKMIPARLIGQQVLCVLSPDGKMTAQSSAATTDLAPIVFTRK